MPGALFSMFLNMLEQQPLTNHKAHLAVNRLVRCLALYVFVPALLFVSHPVNASLSCQKLFSPSLSDFIEVEFSKGEPLPNSLTSQDQQEIRTVFNHQNSLRRSQGLPEIDGKFLDRALSSEPATRHVRSNGILIGDGFFRRDFEWILITKLGNRWSIFPRWDDAYHLNWVYLFENAKLLSAKPSSLFIFEKFQASTNTDFVSLFRYLSRDEQRSWMIGDVETLKKVDAKRGYREPVVYFTPDFGWAAHQSEALIEFRVPTAALIKWSKNKSVTVGDIQHGIFEITIGSREWTELARYITRD